MRSQHLSVAFSITALLTTSVSFAAPGWYAPSKIGAGNLNFGYANEVVVAASADASVRSVAAWVDGSSGALKYAIRTNGVWTSAKNLQAANATAVEQLSDPQVAIDARGMITIAFASNKQGPMTYCAAGLRVVRCAPRIGTIKVATLAPGATAWTKLAVGPAVWSVYRPRLGLDANGDAVLAWVSREKGDSIGSLLLATRTAGVWSTPQSVRSGAPRVWDLAFAGGRGLIGYAESGVDGETIHAIPFTMNGGIEPDEWVHTQTALAAEIRAASSVAGRAALVWDDQYGVQFAVRDAAFGPAQRLGRSASYGLAGDALAYGAQLAADDLGNFGVSWLETQTATGESTIELELLDAAGNQHHGFWATLGTTPPSIALASDGSLATVAWVDDGDGNTFSAEWSAGAFSPAQQLSTGAYQYTSVWGTNVSLAAGSSGVAAAVWLGITGTNGQYRIAAAIHHP